MNLITEQTQKEKINEVEITLVERKSEREIKQYKNTEIVIKDV